MKRLSLIIGFLFFILSCHSQINFVHNSDTLSRYAGVWRWAEGRDTFTINLMIDTLPGTFPNIEESLTRRLGIYSWHQYIKKGKIIESNLESAGNIKKSSAVGTVVISISTIYLGMGFVDKTHDRSLRIFFKLLNKEGTKALWESWPQERWGPPLPVKGDRTIPSPLIMEKVSN